MASWAEPIYVPVLDVLGIEERWNATSDLVLIRATINGADSRSIARSRWQNDEGRMILLCLIDDTFAFEVITRLSCMIEKVQVAD